MIRRTIWGVALLLGFCVGAQAQMQAQGGYLDDYIVQVKAGKRGAYEMLATKIAVANRQNHRDNWIAMEADYGEPNTIRFTSVRQNYADIEKAQQTFMGAMTKALTAPGMMKLFDDLSAISETTRTTFRRRRPDLSIGWPADAAGQAKVVGSSRVLRMIQIHVRPGMGPRMEDELRAVKAAVEKANPNGVGWVSQSAAGDLGTVYYVSQLRSSYAGFDGGQSLQQMMGEGRYKEYLKTISEIVTRSDVTIYRFLPELSNPTEEQVAAAPDFWRPKPMKAAAKGMTPGKAPGKQPEKKPQ